MRATGTMVHPPVFAIRLVKFAAAILTLLWLAGCAGRPPASGQPGVSPSEQPAGTASTATVTPAPAGNEGFAIYLTAEGLDVAQMLAADPAQVRPAATPLISTADILTYHQAGHEIELTSQAYRRIEKLNVPTIGVPFLVCVDRRPVYWGAFWTPYSSASFQGVVIQVLPGARGNTLLIELGYPSAKFFNGQDPRSAPEILEALERAGKLNQAL